MDFGGQAQGAAPPQVRGTRCEAGLTDPEPNSGRQTWICMMSV